MKPARVFAIAGDPGGAAAIGPVLHLIAKHPDWQVEVHSYKQATAIFEREELCPKPLPETTTQKEIEQALLDTGADAVLSATSVNGVDFEKKCLRAAKRLGIPTMSVLDYWSNYEKRFSDEMGTITPDRIAVMDERAAREMEALGFNREMIVITGQPAFDRLATWTTENRTETSVRIRDQLGLGPAQKLVVFASQPLADFYGPDPTTSGHLGYTERTVFPLLRMGLSRIRNKEQITLVVKTHPREKATHWEAQDENGPSEVLVNPLTRSTMEFCVAADLVVGMNSVVLLEAALVGCRVLSLQPGLKLPNSLPDHGQIRFYFGQSPDGVASALNHLFDQSLGEWSPPPTAAPCVLKQLVDLTGLSF